MNPMEIGFGAVISLNQVGVKASLFPPILGWGAVGVYMKTMRNLT